MELNREDIVKALECHISGKLANCEYCPFDKAHLFNATCVQAMCENALTLVKELTEENKKLNERLDREAKCQYDLATKIVNLRDDIKYVKEETIQKMQKKILAKSEYGTINISPWQLDQIAKEVLEERA